MPPHDGRADRAGRAGLLVLVVLAAAVAPPATRAPAQASGEAEVVVRGAAPMPAGEVAWRLVQDVAEPRGEARFEERALGFAIPLPLWNPLLLTDEATGAAYRIDGDGAAFVPDGLVQRRESLDEEAVPYLRLALVPAAEAADPGGDRLLFSGEPFAAPTGDRELTLLRVGLQAGESITVTGAADETFVLVEQGSAIVAGKAGEATLTTIVGSGTSYGIGSFAGDVAIIGERDATYVVAAVIGDAV